MRHPLPRRIGASLLPLTVLLLLASVSEAKGLEAEAINGQEADAIKAQQADAIKAQEADAVKTESTATAEADEPAPPALAFTKTDSTAITTESGRRRSLAVADVSGDFVPELFATPLAIEGIETGGDTGLAFADFDNDGDLDLFVTRAAGRANLLLENLDSASGPAGFAIAEAGELSSGAEADSVAACWGDLDADGDLDLLVVNANDQDDALYLNLGDGTFSRVMEGPVVSNGGDGSSCAAGDLNGDGVIDLYVGNFADDERGAENFLYLNRGGAEFIERPFSVAATTRGHTAGVSLVDYDYDLDLDLFVANAAAGEVNVLYLNDGTARFSKVFESPLAGDEETRSGGHAWGDFDNDGHLDVYLANGLGTGSGQPNQLFFGDGQLSFTAAGDAGDAAAASAVSLATAAADSDRDGDLDLYVAGESGDARYENPVSGPKWLEIRLEGKDSNRMALGARVKVDARVDRKNLQMTRWLLSSQSEPVVRFGFGKQGRPVELEITWPSGHVDTHSDLRPNRSYLAVEGGELTEQ